MMLGQQAAQYVGNIGVLLYSAYDHAGRALGFAPLVVVSIVVLTTATVIVPAVFFRDAARRRDARRVLRLLVKLVRRKD